MASARNPLRNLKLVVDNTDNLLGSLRALSGLELLVGFPEETTDRKEDTGTTTASGKPGLGAADSDLTNAALAYIHDNGAPEANIPARPFMREGMEEAKPEVVQILEATAAKTLKGADSETIVKGYVRAGLVVQRHIRTRINSGIAPPLSAATLRARARKGRKGAQAELDNRAAGLGASTSLAKPLIDTAQMRNAVNFIIRPRKRRR